MSLPGFSVQRPIFITMVTLIVVIVGAFSLSRLRTDLLPNIELPTLTVRTEYEGASPEVMERLVTQIVEEIIATVPGVEEMTSQSSEGSSSIQVRFVWGTDLDVAAMDVQSRLEDEIDELPEDVVRPRLRKFDIASFPVVVLGISSTLDPVELTQLIEDQIRYRFARIPGVAQVDVWGGYDREVRIELDPDRVRALGLPMDRILKAIRDANLDLPTGKIEEGRYEVTLRAPAEFTDLDQIRNTVIALRDGVPVTLSQLAGVKDTYQKLTRIVRVNGERGLRVAIRKQANANTVEVSRAVLAEIEAANKAFPQIHVVPVINQGNFIERSIANVALSVLYGGGLAIMVLLLFLRNFRSTLVISLAIPISMMATFSLIFLGGFTLNLMTLAGLALGVGMMVALRNVVTVEAGRGPIVIDRKDQQRTVTIDANVAGRDSRSVALDIQAILDQIPRPVGYDLSVAGTFEEQKKAFNELVAALVLALILVYMVLACQYESLVNPLVVMFSVPVAAVGVLVTLFLTHTTLNIQSYIGCIMLGGIAVNNAILLVDQAGRLGRDGMPVRDAVVEAGRRRLRPILMTTLTTILGLLPLALGIGEGADAQAPLARAVIGGLTGSTVITLGLIPAIYSLIHRDPP